MSRPPDTHSISRTQMSAGKQSAQFAGAVEGHLSSASLSARINNPATVAHSSLDGKRVAMVTFSSYPADPRPRRAIDALRNQGMNVDLICLADDNTPRREQSSRLNVLRLPIEHRRGGILSYAYTYSAFIFACSVILAIRAFRRRYQLVYVHNMPDILVACALVPKLLGAKVILDQHDPMPELLTSIFSLREDSLSVRAMKWLEKWSIARANAVITVNIACQRIFASRSCRPEKITVVMNSPDEKIFPLRPPVSRPLESSETKRFVIMYHGSMVERNGVDLAIDALARVRESVPGAELRICGRKTPFLEKVLDDVRKRSLEHWVRYLGPKSLEGLVQEIEQCDVGIIPNHRNAFTEINTPTRIFEYLALGKPVIAPRARGISDYFDDESLIFFELGNTEDLARRIEYAFYHGSETTQIVKRGQEVYREHRWSAERQRLTSLVADLSAESVTTSARSRRTV
jgi:glycosyltransferase involved in cell wall biosynthesis